MGKTILEFMDLIKDITDQDFNYRTGGTRECLWLNSRLNAERNEIADRACKELYGISIEDAVILVRMLKNLHIDDPSILCGFKVKKKDLEKVLIPTKKLDKIVNKGRFLPHNNDLDEYYEKYKDEFGF